MTKLEMLLTVLAVALGTQITRWLPFLLFPENRQPPAVMGLLVVYCLKSVTPLAFPYGAPEAIAIAVTALLHGWKRNVLLSIAGGTAVYMLLVQTVFA